MTTGSTGRQDIILITVILHVKEHKNIHPAVSKQPNLLEYWGPDHTGYAALRKKKNIHTHICYAHYVNMVNGPNHPHSNYLSSRFLLTSHFPPTLLSPKHFPCYCVRYTSPAFRRACQFRDVLFSRMRPNCARNATKKKPGSQTKTQKSH